MKQKLILLWGSRASRTVRVTKLIYTERYATRESAKQSFFEYIEVYYNRVRRHVAMGSIASMVFENQYKAYRGRSVIFGRLLIYQTYSNFFRRYFYENVKFISKL